MIGIKYYIFKKIWLVCFITTNFVTYFYGSLKNKYYIFKINTKIFNFFYYIMAVYTIVSFIFTGKAADYYTYIHLVGSVTNTII